ncbi:hypothetical protein ACODHD_12270 [Vagococcus fluvialis]|uniref:hypothetical protein n=1 Tax=Vagococcus fluvialis TaxID=2738 RepID=UPI003B5943CE
MVQQQYTLMGDEVLYENLNSNYSNTLTIDQDNLTLDYLNVFTRLKKESAEIKCPLCQGHNKKEFVCH